MERNQLTTVQEVIVKRTRLAQRRRTLGFSQERLAEQLGVDRTTVIRWERGETEPQPWQRPNLATALAVSLGELNTLLTTRSPDSPRQIVVPLAMPLAGASDAPDDLAAMQSFAWPIGRLAADTSMPR